MKSIDSAVFCIIHKCETEWHSAISTCSITIFIECFIPCYIHMKHTHIHTTLHCFFPPVPTSQIYSPFIHKSHLIWMPNKQSSSPSPSHKTPESLFLSNSFPAPSYILHNWLLCPPSQPTESLPHYQTQFPSAHNRWVPSISQPALFHYLQRVYGGIIRWGLHTPAERFVCFR